MSYDGHQTADLPNCPGWRYRRWKSFSVAGKLIINVSSVYLIQPEQRKVKKNLTLSVSQTEDNIEDEDTGEDVIVEEVQETTDELPGGTEVTLDYN